MKRRPWRRAQDQRYPLHGFAFVKPVTEEQLREKYPDCVVVGFVVRQPDGALELVADDGS